MRVYEIAVEDLDHLAYCGCEWSSRTSTWGLFSSVEAAIQNIKDVEGPIIKKLLHGEDWMLPEPHITWRTVDGLRQVWPPDSNRPALPVVEVVHAVFNVTDPRDHKTPMFIIEVKPVEVKHG
tara:strand:- start:2501 stop:2866 length:366 start_codon:yes stop_codon:yes gene_type:complete